MSIPHRFDSVFERLTESSLEPRARLEQVALMGCVPDAIFHDVVCELLSLRLKALQHQLSQSSTTHTTSPFAFPLEVCGVALAHKRGWVGGWVKDAEMESAYQALQEATQVTQQWLGHFTLYTSEIVPQQVLTRVHDRLMFQCIDAIRLAASVTRYKIKQSPLSLAVNVFYDALAHWQEEELDWLLVTLPKRLCSLQSLRTRLCVLFAQRKPLLVQRLKGITEGLEEGLF